MRGTSHDELMSILCNEPFSKDPFLIPQLTHNEIWKWFLFPHWKKSEEERAKKDPAKTAIDGAVSAAAMYGADAELVRKAVERDFAKQKRDEYYKNLEQ